jgi:ribose/xylose/arabinose/galactoside ABC-type transport system permease subunit
MDQNQRFIKASEKLSKVDLSILKKYTVMFILFVLMVLFSFTSPYFLTWRNLTNIIIQNSYFIIVAIGLSFVMIGGGIDLSVGYQMSLVGVVTAMLMMVYHLPPWLAVVIGLLLGSTLGLINGLIVTSIKIFPLIATWPQPPFSREFHISSREQIPSEATPMTFFFSPKQRYSEFHLMSF